MENLIKPTPGRVVWYWPAKGFVPMGFSVLDQQQPCAASVAFVHNDRLVNLTAHDHLGVAHSLRNVPLRQPGDDIPLDGSHFCEWMPFQKGQAAAADTKGLA